MTAASSRTSPCWARRGMVSGHQNCRRLPDRRARAETGSERRFDSFAPRRRRRFRRRTVHWMVLPLPERLGGRTPELQVVACDSLFRCVLDVDGGRNTLVLGGPLVVAREETAARRDGRTTVDEGRC